MSIRLWKDNDKTCHIEYYPKTASTDYTFNDVVALSNGGQLALMTDAANIIPVGLIQKTIASTDSDYASTTRVPVMICGADAEYLADVGVGTGNANDVGQMADFDGAGNAHQDIDVDNSTYDMLEITGFVSTTQMIVKFVVKTGVLATGPS